MRISPFPLRSINLNKGTHKYNDNNDNDNNNNDYNDNDNYGSDNNDNNNDNDNNYNDNNYNDNIGSDNKTMTMPKMTTMTVTTMTMMASVYGIGWWIGTRTQTAATSVGDLTYHGTSSAAWLSALAPSHPTRCSRGPTT